MKPLKHYMDTFVPLKEFSKKDWPMHQLREQWVATLRNLDSNNVIWKALWFSRKSTINCCGDILWVPLLRIWGVVSYTTLLVLRQYGSEQFIPATHGLNHVEFDYGGPSYVNQLIELSKMWKEPRQMNLEKHVCDIAPGHVACRSNQIKDLVLPPVDNMV